MKVIASACGSDARESVFDLVAASPEMIAILKAADRAAACDAKVLITGESGVGKDVVARYIHTKASRANGPFVAVNCAGLSETLLESELFGHVKGSFTGAYRDTVGKVRLAHRGTLFLDEIGEMSLRMQALLLRFLENGEIQAVGSDAVRNRVDVRVITATNRDLPELVSASKFREDLLYRLRVIHLHVPPLRERIKDIRPLAEHFLAQSRRSLTVTDEAWHALERYRWPGNVRELQNIVDQMAWMSEHPDEPVGVDQLPPIVSSTRAIVPVGERRREIADDLYDALSSGKCSFWEHIYPLFLNRDITRHELRELVRRGLVASRGHFGLLLTLFGMPPSDYKRFLNFLATHDCHLDFRKFRSADPDAAVTRRRPPLLKADLKPSTEREARQNADKRAAS